MPNIVNVGGCRASHPLQAIVMVAQTCGVTRVVVVARIAVVARIVVVARVVGVERVAGKRRVAGGARVGIAWWAERVEDRKGAWRGRWDGVYLSSIYCW